MKYENRIVAFVDILGFKQQFNQINAEGDPFFVETKSALDEISSFINQAEEYHAEDVQYCVFSDAFFVSAPSDLDENVHFVLLACQALSLSMMRRGFLLRGGVAIGHAFHIRNQIFGKAINRAYYLESKVASFPRVILGKEATRRTLDSKIDHRKVLLRAKDGPYFVNPFFRFREFGERVSRGRERNFHSQKKFQELSIVRERILFGLEEYQDSPSIYAKYLWLSKLFNREIASLSTDIGNQWVNDIKAPKP